MDIRLKEFIAFTLEGSYFIVRVETLYSQMITAEEYAWLSPLAGKRCAQVTEEQNATLTRLRLIDTRELTEEQRFAREKRIATNALKGIPPFSSLQLMVAQTCNMHCTYCYGGAGEFGGAGLMDKEVAFAAIDKMAQTHEHDESDAPKPSILFFGGEPLVNLKLIIECAEYCEKLFGKGVTRYNFTTNGALLTEETLDLLDKYGFHFAISYDGPYQNENRPLNDGRDSRAVVLDCIARVIKRYGRAGTISTRYPHQSVAAIEEELKAIDGLTYQINPVAGSLCLGNIADGEERTNEARVQDFTKAALHMIDAVRKGDKKALAKIMSDRYIRDFLRSACASPAMPTKPCYCGAGRGMTCVAQNGDFYPCHCFVGNERYRQGSLAQGYDRGVFERSIMIERPACHDCPVRYGCGGGCVATHASMPEAEMCEEPVFYAPESYCMLQRHKQQLHALVYWSLQEDERRFVLDTYRERV